MSDFNERRFSEWVKRFLVVKGSSPLEGVLPDVIPVLPIVDVNAVEARAFRNDYLWSATFDLSISSVTAGRAAAYGIIEITPPGAGRLSVIEGVRVTGNIPDEVGQPAGGVAFVEQISPNLNGGGTAVFQKDVRSGPLITTSRVVSAPGTQRVNGPYLNSVAAARLPKPNGAASFGWFDIVMAIDQVLFSGSSMNLGIAVTADPTVNWLTTWTVWGYERTVDPAERASFTGKV